MIVDIYFKDSPPARHISVNKVSVGSSTGALLAVHGESLPFISIKDVVAIVCVDGVDSEHHPPAHYFYY